MTGLSEPRQALKSQPTRPNQFIKGPGCWSGRGLSPRPPTRQPGALPTELSLPGSGLLAQ